MKAQYVLFALSAFLLVNLSVQEVSTVECYACDTRHDSHCFATDYPQIIPKKTQTPINSVTKPGCGKTVYTDTSTTPPTITVIRSTLRAVDMGFCVKFSNATVAAEDCSCNTNLCNL